MSKFTQFEHAHEYYFCNALVINGGHPLQHLLFGSRAKTNSDGLLNAPTPERFMAVTLNSYSIPATTSFTAYFFSGISEKQHNVSLLCSSVLSG